MNINIPFSIMYKVYLPNIYHNPTTKFCYSRYNLYTLSFNFKSYQCVLVVKNAHIK